MGEWLGGDFSAPVVVMIVAAVVAVVAVVVLLVLWLRAARRGRAEYRRRVQVEREALDLELSLREQLGRLRIVRELGDVAVHSTSVIVSQADGARFAAQNDPAVAARTAGNIADAARSTLADLRRVMNVVREGEASVAPQPRLKTARDLFGVMRDAGLGITFEEDGAPFAVQQAAELAIYRILQEALSNALKYGGPGTEVKVSFSWRGEGLQVLVDDDGARNQARLAGEDSAASPSKGYTVREDLTALTADVMGPGITEMKERAGLFGGVFSAYRVPGVGFSIAVVFPSLKHHNGVHSVDLGRS